MRKVVGMDYHSLGELVAKDLREHGYYVWPSFLAEDAVTSYREHCLDLLDPSLPYAQTHSSSIRVWNLMNYGDVFINLLFDERLRSSVTAILGEGFLLSDFSLNVVFPHNKPDKVHMDYPFNEMRGELAHGILSVQCILALDDFTLENGATEFIPKSHRNYYLPAKDEKLAFKKFVAPKGSLLIMTSSTWHRAGVNRSNSNRMAILLCFVERWIRPMIGLDELSAEMLRGASHDLQMLLGVLREPEEVGGTYLVHKPILSGEQT